jgi:hypothetical protein
MITIDQPAMGLNDRARHHIHVQMWNTWDVPPDDPADHIAGWVAEVVRGAPGGRLKNVVFSCHGSPGSIGIGQGINAGNVNLFARWRGLVDKIWIRACRVAFIPPGGAGGTGPAAGDGNVFCSRLAQAAQAYVVASTELQIGEVGRVLPFGKLDSYEGLVLSYGPGGNVTWSHRYRSGYQTPARWFGLIPQNWHGNPD